MTERQIADARKRCSWICRKWHVPEGEQDDAAQIALLELVRSEGNHDPSHGQWEAWCQMVCHRSIAKYLSYRNRHKRRLLLLDDMATVVPVNPDAIYGFDEPIHCVADPHDPYDAIDQADQDEKYLSACIPALKLTDLEREALLNYFLVENYDEAAAIMGTTVKRVDNALYRVRDKASRYLAGQSGTHGE